MKIINVLWDTFLKLNKKEQEIYADNIYTSIKDLIDKKIINKNENLSELILAKNELEEDIVINNVESLLYLLLSKYPNKKLLKEIPELYNKNIDENILYSKIKQEDFLYSFGIYTDFEKNLLPLFNSTDKEFIIKFFTPDSYEHKKIINNILNLIIKDIKIYEKIEDIIGEDLLKNKILNMEVSPLLYKYNFHKINIDNINKKIPELKNNYNNKNKTFLMVLLSKKESLLNEYMDDFNLLDTETKNQIKKYIIDSEQPIKNKIYLYDNWYNDKPKERYKDILDQYLIKKKNEDYEIILSLSKTDNDFKNFLKERKSNILLNLLTGKELNIKLLKDYIKEFPELKEKNSNINLLKKFITNVPINISIKELKLKEFILTNFDAKFLLGTKEENFNNFPWLEIKYNNGLSASIKDIIKIKFNEYGISKGFLQINIQDIFDTYDEFLKIKDYYRLGYFPKNQNKIFIDKISKKNLPLSFFEDKNIKNLIMNINEYSNERYKNKDEFLNSINNLKIKIEKDLLSKSIAPKKDEINLKKIVRL